MMPWEYEQLEKQLREWENSGWVEWAQHDAILQWLWKWAMRVVSGHPNA